jgi:alkanesulfonate monooxygenase SsuD/methylene tetrahydromethanopterin reductase-like flavin-dependent oxidoreductase (luciferase family)
MRYAISMPNFVPARHAAEVDLQRFVEWARMAEAAGWDAFFIWDHLLFWKTDVLYVMDPWVLLSAIATATQRIKLGPMVAPLARRRPWQVAREAVSLDHLSNGRLILGVGIGAPTESDFLPFGEPGDLRALATRLDEGLEVISGLWSGDPFTYHGQHFDLDEVRFLPTPLQKPRIPIWVAALWPRKPPLRRAARWDGVFPLKMAEPNEFATMAPDDVRALLEYVRRRRTSERPFDVVVAGWTGGLTPRQAHEHVQTYSDAGATWWIEGLDWQGGAEPRSIDQHIQHGPPR